jgi:hypothetical protein
MPTPVDPAGGPSPRPCASTDRDKWQISACAGDRPTAQTADEIQVHELDDEIRDHEMDDEIRNHELPVRRVVTRCIVTKRMVRHGPTQ